MDTEKRRRNIIWTASVDAEAVRLTAERGLFGSGGVSELLAQLVREEAATPRLKLQEPSAGYKASIKSKQGKPKTPPGDGRILHRGAA